jgi:hypothetical protein
MLRNPREKALRKYYQPQVIAALTAYGSDLLRGAIVTVEPGRVRVRPPDDAA